MNETNKNISEHNSHSNKYDWKKGSCHCGNTTFEVRMELKKHQDQDGAFVEVDVYKCNCSICWMKQNHHFVVPDECFRLGVAGGSGWFYGNDLLACAEESSDQQIRFYRFNTGTALHCFCSNCGICSFYKPRSNPNGVAITIYCMEDYGPETNAKDKIKVNWKSFDGVHWEQSMKTSDIKSKTG